MSTQYAVEKNVPIPYSRHTGRPKGRLRLAIESMDVGDSLRVDDASRGRLIGIGNILKPKKFVTRADGDAFRIWRVQ